MNANVPLTQCLKYLLSFQEDGGLHNDKQQISLLSEDSLGLFLPPQRDQANTVHFPT